MGDDSQGGGRPGTSPTGRLEGGRGGSRKPPRPPSHVLSIYNTFGRQSSAAVPFPLGLLLRRPPIPFPRGKQLLDHAEQLLPRVGRAEGFVARLAVVQAALQSGVLDEEEHGAAVPGVTVVIVGVPQPAP